MIVTLPSRTLGRLFLVAGLSIVSGMLQTCEKFEPEGFLHVNTGEAAYITGNSAQVSGEVTDSGGNPVTARGISWGTSSGPSVDGDHNEEGSGTGSFSSTLSGLIPGTLYYYRAFASSSQGTTYGEEKSFSTLAASLATVLTRDASDIDKTTATLNGEVSGEGDFPVTDRGFYYGTSDNPAESGTQVAVSGGQGTFTADLSGLAAATTYHFVAYATSNAGTAYCSVKNFTTAPEAAPPSVSTYEATVIRNDEASLNGEVTHDGGATVTERGFYYGIYPDPQNRGLKAEAGSGSGSYKKIQDELSGSRTYYFVAYATNSAGTGFGEVQSFTSAYYDHSGRTGTLTDIEGNSYGWTGIGQQVWMAGNLKTTRMADGTAILHVPDSADWSHLGESVKAYSWYDNDDRNRNTYGLMYTWDAAMNGGTSTDINPSQVQGVCPDGWHLPSDAEWKQLEMFLGMSQAEADGRDSRGTDQGGKLKEAGLEHWKSPNAGATNSTGFNGLPGGYRDDDGEFELLGEFTYFWTTTNHEPHNAFIHRLDYWNSKVYRNPFHRSCGMSVRCVRD